MKDRTDTVQSDSHSRTRSFADLGSCRLQHRFDVSPRQIRSDRLIKNRLERALVFLIHLDSDGITV